jgi:invasion protein IalB
MLRSRLPLSLLTLIVAAMAALLLLSGIVRPGIAQQATNGDKPGMAPRGERNAHEIKYGDWQKFCFKTPGSSMVCRTTITGSWETGQSAVRIDLIEREGAARLRLFLPVGLYLQTSAKLTVDQGKPYQVPWIWCLTNACVAADKANPDLVKEMSSGDKLKLEVVDSSLLSVSTLLPLGQFASVRNGAPSRIFQQDVDE